ncbi:hypothetical protein AN958_06284, partial [Leucoagaricus sp. SymC.cos]
IIAVEKLRNGGILLETNTEETAKWLREPANSEMFRRHLNVSVDFTQRTTNYVVKFVSCHLNLEEKTQVEEIMNDNCWDDKTFIKARWAKAVHKRREGQREAHLIVTLADDGEIGERILEKGYVTIQGRRHQIERDRKIPVRCAKCQEYGHYFSDCKSTTDTCGKCAGNGHHTDACPSDNTRCANCKEDGHGATSSDCPTFQRKLKALNEREKQGNTTTALASYNL